ncbi:hypothetical protein SAMN04487831_11029 [Pseudobutyrivibrio sp. UC1225]|uniref:hypothetical protein n=1 Tax=Pseudobutyrivibrio sp. UC1225 TaxID=1798185 RepID=UPI0008DFCBEE|nr:hypothetical protein [Pseudobutyrivibrio sp. UC1225]SFO16200.1 hypothetical protein SAMN04487831_11029 [Pseudobutyrivibrio sp. UC1225]
MSEHEISYNLISGDRTQKRKSLITSMLEEECGTGTGTNCSRYRYNVESYGEYGIYLKRPTQLNKGFDFTVNVDGMWFKKERRYSCPSHQDIFDALDDCRSHYPGEYDNISFMIEKIYNCEDVDLSEVSDIYFHDFEGSKRPIAIILLAIKWLFMEQDCAYWNYSGRAMLYKALQKQQLI